MLSLFLFFFSQKVVFKSIMLKLERKKVRKSQCRLIYEERRYFENKIIDIGQLQSFS